MDPKVAGSTPAGHPNSPKPSPLDPASGDRHPVASELDLARLALDLGACAAGGPLTSAEERVAAAAAECPAAAPDVVEAVRREILDGADPLGEALARLRPARTRRGRGQFWTPPAIVAPMMAWALAADPTRLVDAGCGSGRFALEALRARHGISVVAIDLDPLACLLTRAAFAVLGTASAISATSARVICGDYLTAGFARHDGTTAWVGNPPYVRHHDLAPETKAWAARAARSIGCSISGLAGLHALFFLATAIHARPGDVGCFVTSAEWLDVGYGSIVRHLFADVLGGRALDLIDARAVPFEEAMTTALVACFEVGRAPSGAAVHLVGRSEGLARLEAGTTIPSDVLAATTRWSNLFTPRRPAPPAGGTPGGTPGRTLGEIARVHRGFVTGGNDFFLMTRAQATERGLAPFVTPAITAAAEIFETGGVIRDTPARKVVLDLAADFDRSAHPAVDAYLSQGERLGIDAGYVAGHRKPWWRVGPLTRPPIVASYMARQAPKFARNPDGLALVNIGHGIYPKVAMTDVQLDALVATLNRSRGSFAGAGRTYHGGLEKFEPREMEALPIPDDFT